MNFICADGATSSGSIIIYVVLIVALIAMLILPYFTQRKKNQEYMKMIDSIKVGDLVKTAGGIIGKVNKITDKGEIKTVVLETGSKSEKSYMELDMSMIYCVLKSTKVEKEEEEKEPETVAEAETKAEGKAEETVEVSQEKPAEETKAEETKAEETKAEEKTAETPKKKSTAKKATAKKTTKK